MTRCVGEESVDDLWRIDGQWMALPDEVSQSLERHALCYAIHSSALPVMLEVFDAGIELDACVIEAALRPPGDVVSFGALGYTREHLPGLLKARARRESEPSELTSRMTSFAEGAISPTAADLLTSLVDLHGQARTQGPPLQRHIPDVLIPADMAIDWGQLLPDDAKAQLGWTRLVQFTAALVALSDDVVVISVRTEQFDNDAYVQLCQEDDGALHLEAVSDAFLEPPLSPDAVDLLHEMGWRDPPGDGLPNYVRFLEPGETAPGDVARLMVEALRRVYSCQPGDRYRFEPATHVRALLRGDFGPKCAANPALSEGQKARLFTGLRFPHDVGDAI